VRINAHENLAMWPPEDGKPYMPANGTEGCDFEDAWCAHCKNRNGDGGWEDEFGNDVEGRCHLLDKAFYAEQPTEWKWRNGKPVCTAYRKDADNPPRCPLTMEMF